MPFPRRAILAAATVLALAACNKPSTDAGAPLAADMSMGADSAPLTLIEYASTTCPHCAHFHAEVLPGLKSKYIDTGRVKYIFREFPTPPEAIAVAEFQIARCAGKDKYFALLDTFFKQQTEIFDAARSPQGAKPALLAIARQAGLSEQQFETCIADEAGMKRIMDGAEKGVKDFQISGTPTVILDGQALPVDKFPDAYNLEGLSKLIDAKLTEKVSGK